MNQNTINEMVIDIIDGTSDGDNLSPRHLKLLELAVNGFIDDENFQELTRIHQMVENGNYIDWFHSIEHMTKDHNDCIRWKGVVVGKYDFEDWEEKAAIEELHSRCLHIESLGLKPDTRNCDFSWNEYQNLKPDAVDAAYPWVIDNYYASNGKWKEINEYHYDWYLECVPPIAMHSNSYLGGEPYTHTDDGQGVYLSCRYWKGKYYAKLMTLKQYQSKTYDKIRL